MSGYDPRQSVSVPLTEVRTVLSRAKSALAIINREGHHHPGHDLDAMKAMLETVVKMLEPWERKSTRGGRGRRH